MSQEVEKNIKLCASAISQLNVIDGELKKARQRVEILEEKRAQVQAEVDGRKASLANGTDYMPPAPSKPEEKRGVFGGVINAQDAAKE